MPHAEYHCSSGQPGLVSQQPKGHGHANILPAQSNAKHACSAYNCCTHRYQSAPFKPSNSSRQHCLVDPTHQFGATQSSNQCPSTPAALQYPSPCFQRPRITATTPTSFACKACTFSCMPFSMTMPLEATGAAHACPAPAVSPVQHRGYPTADQTTRGGS